MWASTVATVSIGGFGAGAVLTDTTSLGIAGSVAARMPAELVGASPGSTPLTYVIAADEAGVSITRDGLLECKEVDVRTAIRWLHGDLDRHLACEAQSAVFVHAGVVSWRGQAIVIPGRSGTGKSTLVAELVRSGAVYYSDEFAVLVDGEVYPYARPLAVRVGDHDQVDLNLAVCSSSRPPLPLGVIVATSFVDGVAWTPELRRGVRGALTLLDNMVAGRIRPELAIKAAAAAASRVPALWGPRPDAHEVAGPLLERIDELLDGKEPESTEVTRQRRLQLMSEEPGRRLRPARYLVFRDFLRAEDHDAIVRLALSRQDAFVTSEVMHPDGHGGEDRTNRVSRSLYDLGEVSGIFERATTSLLPYIRKELDLAWFSVERMEIQLAVHENDSFFRPHLDNNSGLSSRTLTCVYHFSASPDYEGGELVLYDSIVGENAIELAPSHFVIPPVDNSLVCFPSGTYHEVRPVRRTGTDFAGNRFAVTMWFLDSGFRPWQRVA